MDINFLTFSSFFLLKINISLSRSNILVTSNVTSDEISTVKDEWWNIFFDWELNFLLKQHLFVSFFTFSLFNSSKSKQVYVKLVSFYPIFQFEVTSKGEKKVKNCIFSVHLCMKKRKQYKDNWSMKIHPKKMETNGRIDQTIESF